MRHVQLSSAGKPIESAIKANVYNNPRTGLIEVEKRSLKRLLCVECFFSS
jgi:hypothetical protein